MDNLWLIVVTRPGKQTVGYWSHGPIEIVDLPSYKKVDLSSSLFVCLPGRVSLKFMCQLGSSSLVGNPCGSHAAALWGWNVTNPTTLLGGWNDHYWSLQNDAKLIFCGKHDVFVKQKMNKVLYLPMQLPVIQLPRTATRQCSTGKSLSRPYF